jgi:hypothetical protein
MKATFLFFAVVGAAVSARALESAVPEPFPETRYQPLSAQSPFALATPVAAPVVADKSFADGWYLGGVSQWDGKNFVVVRSRDLSVQFSLYGDERREDNGVKLQNVEWSASYGKTTATIEKDGQFAKLELLTQTEVGSAPSLPGVNPANSRAIPVIRAPGAPLQPNASQPRPNIPRPSGAAAGTIGAPQGGIAVPQPSYQITPGVPANSKVQPLPGSMQPLANPAVPPPSEGRRRIRMINAPPAQ